MILLADLWERLGDAFIQAIPMLVALAVGYIDLRKRMIAQHKQMNSRLDEQLEVTRKLGEAKGRADEKEEQANRDK